MPVGSKVMSRNSKQKFSSPAYSAILFANLVTEAFIIYKTYSQKMAHNKNEPLGSQISPVNGVMYGNY